MYVRGLNEYWTEHYKKIVEYIEIYIEEHKWKLKNRNYCLDSQLAD
jgi:hypothetical protein